MHPIEHFRRARGWTQEELARQTDVSINTVRAWERGAMPRAANLRKLSVLFEIDLIRLADTIVSWHRETNAQPTRKRQSANVNAPPR
jgi:transcriptional regulator with XRE-family HTH domain